MFTKILGTSAIIIITLIWVVWLFNSSIDTKGPLKMRRGKIILYIDTLTQCQYIQVGNDTFMRMDKDLNQIGCR